MATEEDNFDIDIYGDGDGEGDGAGVADNDGHGDYQDDDEEVNFDLGQDDLDFPPTHETKAKSDPQPSQSHPSQTPMVIDKKESQAGPHGNGQIGSLDGTPTPSTIPAKPPPVTAPPQQGTKRKETSDGRPLDAGATSALMISDLHWWTTEDDIRGWANDAEVEQELQDVTFSEHKVNGKSKG